MQLVKKKRGRPKMAAKDKIHGFNGALIIDYKYYDFKDAIIFLNKNKDTIV